MNVLDLFSGIGGFSLGLERAGMRTVAFCEIDPFCRRVLAKQWPGVPCYDDVRGLTAARLRADGIAADVICGGFPCQDISEAGRGSGIDGNRSGLWKQYARLIGELRPRYVIVENVSALLSRGMGTVLGDLAALRYDAEWHGIPASAVGAPHIRDRIWIMAYPGCVGRDRRRSFGPGRHKPSDGCEALADATDKWSLIVGRQQLAEGRHRARSVHQWEPEPALGRVADGVSGRMAQIGALGNAVVPQIPEIIGRAIMTARLTTKQTGDR